MPYAAYIYPPPPSLPCPHSWVVDSREWARPPVSPRASIEREIGERSLKPPSVCVAIFNANGCVEKSCTPTPTHSSRPVSTNTRYEWYPISLRFHFWDPRITAKCTDKMADYFLVSKANPLKGEVSFFRSQLVGRLADFLLFFCFVFGGFLEAKRFGKILKKCAKKK